MARSNLSIAFTLALLTPAVLVALAGTATPAAGLEASAQTPRGEDWTLERRIEPGEGFTLTAEGTVDGEPARLVHAFDLETSELTIRYTLGEDADPERIVEATIRLEGAYVFEDDGDARFGLSDRVISHQRVDPDDGAYLVPVRTDDPLSSVRAVVPLEDTGNVVLTLTTASRDAMLRGDALAPTESRMNLTVVDIQDREDGHVALAAAADASAVSQADDALVRLDGPTAGVLVDWDGALEEAPRGPSGASVFVEEDSRALVFLASPGSRVVAHDVGTSVVHTSSQLGAVGDAVRGQAGPFLLGLVGSATLVGIAAWRKLEA